MKLSEHFTLDEAILSQTAVRLGIENVPDKYTVSHMVQSANGLEQVRDLLGCVMHVNSWFRILRLNRAIGSHDHSAHIQGWAVDFTAPNFGTPLEICKAIVESDIDYDQVINEQKWVHISFAPTMRKMALTAHFNNGRAEYKEGIH